MRDVTERIGADEGVYVGEQPAMGYVLWAIG
jgi:hypothetical protein